MARFGGTSAITSSGGSRVVTLGTFKRDEIDARSGTPIPFGERPADRPFSEHLGNGLSYSNIEGRATSGSGSVAPEKGFLRNVDRPTDPLYFRSRAGIKPFSWEEPNA